MSQKSYNQFWLEGLVPAVFTPFHEDGELNLSKIDEYCEFLLKNNIKAVFVNGTTGEGKSMTKEERKLVAEKWIFTASGRLKVVVNVSGLNVRESIELAKHAVHIRADAIACLPPLFFKPNSIECLVDHCKMVADAAPSLPFYYYHLPAMTGVERHSLGGNVAAVKPMMALVGLDLGPPRHPMRSMTVDELIDFNKDVDLIGFKDWEPAIML